MSPRGAEARGGPSVLGSCEAPASLGLLVYQGSMVWTWRLPWVPPRGAFAH